MSSLKRLIFLNVLRVIFSLKSKLSNFHFPLNFNEKSFKNVIPSLIEEKLFDYNILKKLSDFFIVIIG